MCGLMRNAGGRDGFFARSREGRLKGRVVVYDLEAQKEFSDNELQLLKGIACFFCGYGLPMCAAVAYFANGVKRSEQCFIADGVDEAPIVHHVEKRSARRLVGN